MVRHKVFHRAPAVKLHWNRGMARDMKYSSIEKRIDALKNDLLNRFLVNPF